MSGPSVADGELTPQDRVIAELVSFGQSLPGGLQVAIGIRLQRCAETAERLFAAHQLPRREQLIAELSFWKVHAEQGVKFLQHSEEVLAAVTRQFMPRVRWW